MFILSFFLTNLQNVAHLVDKTPLIIKTNPLIVSVGKRNLLFAVPYQRGVVFIKESAYLVVGEEARLVCEVSGGSATGSWRADVEFHLVNEGKGSAVGRHADHELLLWRALFHPLTRTVILKISILY